MHRQGPDFKQTTASWLFGLGKYEPAYMANAPATASSAFKIWQDVDIAVITAYLYVSE